MWMWPLLSITSLLAGVAGMLARAVRAKVHNFSPSCGDGALKPEHLGQSVAM
jgi:hypothetical protein